MKIFYPFDEINKYDNQINDSLDQLDLDKVQLALLWQLLRRFEISVWFNADGDLNPRLEITTFLDLNHVAKIDLIDLLKDIVTDEPDLGREQEIAALVNLKNLIEQAIASRQEQGVAL